MDDKIKLAVSERIDELLRELRRVNSDYDAVRTAVGETAGRIEAIIEALNGDDREAWEQHFNMGNQLEATEQEYIYLQGIKDGFKLLKWIQE